MLHFEHRPPVDLGNRHACAPLADALVLDESVFRSHFRHDLRALPFQPVDFFFLSAAVRSLGGSLLRLNRLFLHRQSGASAAFTAWSSGSEPPPSAPSLTSVAADFLLAEIDLVLEGPVLFICLRIHHLRLEL